MCTVSWLHRPDGFDLFCNRDERFTRPRAHMPRVSATGGVRYLAPCDPLGGGTWVGANEYGVAICVLNAYPESWTASGRALTSRGLLVSELLGRRSAIDATLALSRRDLGAFAPFTLVLLQPGMRAVVAAWDGRCRFAMHDGDRTCPLASSSVDELTAVRRRRAAWRSRQPTTVCEATAFHHSHTGGVCMHREDAETVSFTHVHVSPDRVQLHYWPDSPCRADFIVTTTLDRANSHGRGTRPARILDVAG